MTRMVRRVTLAIALAVAAVLGVVAPAEAGTKYHNTTCGPTAFQVTSQLQVDTTYDFALTKVTIYRPPTAGYPSTLVRVYLDDAYTRRWEGSKWVNAGQNAVFYPNAAARFLGATLSIRVYPGGGAYQGHGCNIVYPHYSP